MAHDPVHMQPEPARNPAHATNRELLLDIKKGSWFKQLSGLSKVAVSLTAICVFIGTIVGGYNYWQAITVRQADRNAWVDSQRKDADDSGIPNVRKELLKHQEMQSQTQRELAAALKEMVAQSRDQGETLQYIKGQVDVLVGDKRRVSKGEVR